MHESNVQILKNEKYLPLFEASPVNKSDTLG